MTAEVFHMAKSVKIMQDIAAVCEAGNLIDQALADFVRVQSAICWHLQGVCAGGSTNDHQDAKLAVS
jgi:hypothetical protein